MYWENDESITIAWNKKVQSLTLKNDSILRHGAIQSSQEINFHCKGK